MWVFVAVRAEGILFFLFPRTPFSNARTPFSFFHARHSYVHLPRHLTHLPSANTSPATSEEPVHELAFVHELAERVWEESKRVLAAARNQGHRAHLASMVQVLFSFYFLFFYVFLCGILYGKRVVAAARDQGHRAHPASMVQGFKKIFKNILFFIFICYGSGGKRSRSQSSSCEHGPDFFIFICYLYERRAVEVFLSATELILRP